jgi:hypothetical protein
MLQSEHLATKRFPQALIARLSRICREVTDIAGRFTANYGECCRSVARQPPFCAAAAITRTRHSGATPPPLLAGNRGREEDRELQKIQREETYAKSSSD